ncbi:hypothetical protein CAPTEDRAFT_19097 [Capitella teleta]|uniref:Fe2OG dioxygenase domain-containing protein n=1 Tax=Capitella teleta TaxID=283909 RepID=R7VBP7_CAPTE|nr:hypothetical protein CAPTEDRAFT_19097 [Capitella teleta]|eukprot:ELU16059.1 hypothetical protein CAPTEDRAFT_19097 [Capitella teleta]
MEGSAANVVDISPLLQIQTMDFKEPASAAVCRDLVREITQSGFVALSNHGIPIESTDKLISNSSSFFAQDDAFKQKYARKGIDGWSGPGIESLNPGTPGDYKDAYNYSRGHATQCWPEEVAPGMKEAFEDVFERCDALSKSILKAFAVGLGMEDAEFFAKAHYSQSSTNLRCVVYPPIGEGTQLKDGQMRCGQHSDFGSLTLLFQDGGLEVLSETGQWLSLPGIPGTVLLIVGDLMQRWTADRLKAIVHKVDIPREEEARKAARKSVIFFVQPDNEWVVRCFNGSDKYPPIKTIDYFQSKVDALY